MNFDFVIENPLIYDGAGRKPYRNDVGVCGDVICAIGRLDKAEAKRRIAAGHLALSPGFIDVHSHAEMTMHREDHPSILEPLVRQGITTYVGGNCGVSMGPVSQRHRDLQMMFYDFFLGADQEPHIHWSSFGEMLDVIEGQGMLLNAAILCPHGILRMDAMGDSAKLASPIDIEEMKTLLARCLEEGAIGLSTGLMYFPGLCSDQWELTELARVVHDYNGVFTSHIRSYNSDTLGYAIDEVTSIGRDAEVPVQISHLFWIPNFPRPFDRLSKVVIKAASFLYNKRPFPIPIDSAMKPHLEKIAGLVDRGYPIGVDAMPTSAGFTHLLAFFPPWSLRGGTDAIKRRLADPATRKEILKSVENGDTKWPHRARDSWSMNLFKLLGWNGIFIMSVVTEKNQYMTGRNLVDIADETGRHPFDVACDLLLEENCRVLVFETATFPGDPLVEAALLQPLLDPNVAIVTDTILLGYGLPSHLFYDCYPKFLSEYGRDRGEISLSQAIRKCTSLPAGLLRIPRRGTIREGCFADMLLFDVQRLRSRSTATDPKHFPDGVEYVFINGASVVDPEGFHPEPRAGRMLRRGM